MHNVYQHNNPLSLCTEYSSLWLYLAYTVECPLHEFLWVSLMQFPAAAYDAALLKLMSRAFDDACGDIARVNASCDAAKTMMALRIMTAVAAGERNIERLRLLALQAIDGREIANDR